MKPSTKYRSRSPRLLAGAVVALVLGLSLLSSGCGGTNRVESGGTRVGTVESTVHVNYRKGGTARNHRGESGSTRVGTVESTVHLNDGEAGTAQNRHEHTGR